MLRQIAVLSFFFAASFTNLQAAPPATYRIAGIVVDSVTGQPLEGAEVTISSVANLEEQQDLLTSSTGRFLFANLATGKYSVTASRRGYALQGFQQHERFSTGIAVGPGLDSEHIRFPLAPSSVITGVVIDEWGDPVRDAKVLLFQQSTFDGSRGLHHINQTTTDDQGHYRFAHLLAGTYAVAVRAHPWYANGASPLLAQTSANLQSVVSSGDQVVSVEGLRQQIGESIVQSSSDPLFDVVYPITFFPNVTSLVEATRFALAPGATENADFQLHAVPSVHLRVRVPIQRVTLAATSEEEAAQQTANQGESSTDVAQVVSSPAVGLALKIGDSFTDQIEPARKEIAPGIFELSGIPPGQVEVSMLSGPEFNVVSHGRTLNLSADTELDLSAQGDANISGVILSSRFTPPPATASTSQAPLGQVPPAQALESDLSNETLTFRSPKTGETYEATVSSRGKFTLESSTLPAGSYEVEFSEQSQLHVSALEATGATASGRSIEIPSGQPVTITVHAAEANCSLSGFALKYGKPVAGAMVLLVPQDPGHDMSLYRRDQSDSDGSFSMSPLFPGRYILLAIENGWDLEWADPKVMFQYLPGGQPLELKPGASLTLNAKVQ